jgi:hypothetical protein
MRRAIAIVFAMLAVLATGCASERPEGADPLVSYQRSGGIAGVNERLVIDPDGEAQLAVGEPDPDAQRFEIGDPALERLRSGLAAADFAAIDRDSGLGCADCFEYEISYDGVTASFNEAAEVPDSVREVTAQLGRIVEAHLPERP